MAAIATAARVLVGATCLRTLDGAIRSTVAGPTVSDAGRLGLGRFDATRPIIGFTVR